MNQEFVVTPKEAGRTLAAVLKGRLGLSWSQVRRLVELRRVRLAGQGCGDPVRRVRTGQRVEVRGAEKPKASGSPTKQVAALPSTIGREETGGLPRLARKSAQPSTGNPAHR